MLASCWDREYTPVFCILDRGRETQQQIGLGGMKAGSLSSPHFKIWTERYNPQVPFSTVDLWVVKASANQLSYGTENTDPSLVLPEDVSNWEHALSDTLPAAVQRLEQTRVQYVAAPGRSTSDKRTSMIGLGNSFAGSQRNIQPSGPTIKTTRAMQLRMERNNPNVAPSGPAIALGQPSIPAKT